MLLLRHEDHLLIDTSFSECEEALNKTIPYGSHYQSLKLVVCREQSLILKFCCFDKWKALGSEEKHIKMERLNVRYY